MKHLELAILRVTYLARMNDLVAPLDRIAKYLEEQLHMKPEIVRSKIEDMERRKLIEPKEKMVNPKDVGYDPCDVSRRVVRGYVITDKGKGTLDSYGPIVHHAFGVSLFPEPPSGC